MAIIYTRGEKTKYTGFDKVQHEFGNVVEKIKSAPRRFIEHLEEKDKKIQEFKRDKNRKMIERTFGSVENYEKFNKGAR